MPKFLFKASYTADGARGLIKEGGSARRAAVDQSIQKAGGRMEAFYYAYGADDAYVLADLPSAAVALAFSLQVNASGSVTLSTTPLVTPEEIDAAAKATVGYRPPGA